MTSPTKKTFPAQTAIGVPRRRRTLAAGKPAALAPNNYALFLPLHCQSNYAYPLLIWLHGEGADESQLARVMPALSLRNYAAIAPRWQPRTPQPWQGFDSPQQDDDSLQERLAELIHLAGKRIHSHKQRIFLAGAGEGGATALRIGLAQRECYAGVLAFDAAIPADRAAMCSLAAARRLPIFIAAPSGQDNWAKLLADANSWIMDRVAAQGETNKLVRASSSCRERPTHKWVPRRPAHAPP